jgi:PleD family two-component response regulator
LLIFPRLGSQECRVYLEQVCRGIEDLNVVHSGNLPFARLTVTFGLCSLMGDTAGDLERALKEADLALYEGKRAGKNRVQLSVSCP